MRTANNSAKQCLIFVLLVALLACVGCSRNLGPMGVIMDESVYEAAYDPDGLVSNFELAWENRDIEAYRDLVLYDGVRAARDGEVYEPFVFYRIDYPRDPASWQGYDEEVANVARMFSGKPGRDGKVPGIKSISVDLLKIRDWTEIGERMVHGHAVPPGARSCVFECEAFFELESSYAATGQEGAVNGFTVLTDQEFMVIPVMASGLVEEQPEYRLWKWLEIQEPVLRVQQP